MEPDVNVRPFFQLVKQCTKRVSESPQRRGQKRGFMHLHEHPRNIVALLAEKLAVISKTAHQERFSGFSPGFGWKFFLYTKSYVSRQAFY